ncbi:hypothetical protein [Indioceanicola profundi]|uniref:hypothetical protein n=1 Tax=Indioceanicola profundi TaxID=2220096 RepID=UPI000E6AADA3|nr:hypothetical protein [Indioceanicola profundi]
MTTDRKDQPPTNPQVPEVDLQRKGHSSQGSATGGGGHGAPVERSPAENPKEHGLPPAAAGGSGGGGAGGTVAGGPAASTGVSSGLQPGGMRPETGAPGNIGKVGQGGGSAPDRG